MKDNIFFQPFVGKDYANGGIFGKRIMILGESHYCDEGLLAPEFKTDGNFVTVVFRYNRNGVNLQLVNSNPTSTQQVLELVGILKDGEYSVREIMSFLMLKDRVNFLYKYITPALEEGLVSMKYPDNPKHPKQKYMLTEKGRKILEK